MRLAVTLFVTLFFTMHLYAQQAKNLCYNIQIGSFSKASLKDIKKISFPKACIIVKKDQSYVIRCECDGEEDIRKKLPYYQKNIPDAFLTQTDRTLFKKNLTKEQAPEEKTTEEKEETLKELMYKVFIYNSDLKNAYKIAREELQKNLHSLVWRKRIADVLSWRGRSKEALKHYVYIYKKTKDKEIEKMVLDASIQGHDYQDAYYILLGKISSNPKNIKNIDQFIHISEQLGNPEKAAATLDKIYNKTKSAAILKKSADLYFKLGLLKKAKKRFEILKDAKLLDLESGITLSKIFFVEKNLPESLKVLLGIGQLAAFDDIPYWQELSDIYTYLNKHGKAAIVLKTLCMQKKCRQSDYDRLITFYLDKDKEFTAKVSLKAFKELKNSAHFFYFARTSLERKKAGDVIKVINAFSKDEREKYNQLPLFGLVMAQVNEQSGFTKEALLSYKKALSLDPGSVEILSQYSWFLISKHKTDEIKKILKTIERRAKTDERLNILAAAINFKLNRMTKAYKYYMAALENEPDNIDLQLDFANLLMVMGKTEYSAKVSRAVYHRLHKRLQKNQKLLQNKTFLRHYLRASLYFKSMANYRKLMKSAKNILEEKAHNDLTIAWKLYTDSTEYVEYLSSRLKHPELWLQLYVSMKKDDTSALQDLLYRYAALLPIDGKIQAELKTKQIGAARSHTFEALEENPQSQALYQTKYEIDTKYGNKLNSEAGHENRETLKTSYGKIENSYHLLNRYYLGSSMQYGKNSSDKIILSDNLSEEFAARLWLKMLTKNGYVEIGGGYRDAYTQYPQYFFNLYTNLTNRLRLNLEMEKNKNADETVNLHLKGKKDFVSLGARYQFDKRLAFAAQASANRYQLQKGGALGEGYKLNIEAQQKIKFSYPDIIFREYMTIADFTDKGVMDLPDDYFESGLGMQVGMGAMERYSGGWKPYADLSATHHDSFGLSFAGQVGVSGRFIGDDYLNVSLNYNRSASDSNEELWLLKLKHSYLY